MSEFEKLLADLDDLVLAKSAVAEPADLLKAEKGGQKNLFGAADSDDEEDEEDEEDEGDEGDEKFTKALSVTLPSGEMVEAYDGTRLVKALSAQMSSAQDEMRGSLDQVHQALEKTTALLKSLVGDNEALRAQVDSLASAGRGRKSSLSVHDKPATSAPAPAAPGRKELLAKCLVAQQAGRISGHDVATAENALNKGMELPAYLVSRIG